MLISISESMDRSLECPFPKVVDFFNRKYLNWSVFLQIQGILRVTNWFVNDDLLPSYTEKQKFKVNAKFFAKLPGQNKKKLLFVSNLLGEKK